MTRERDISQARLKQAQNGIAHQQNINDSSGQKIAADIDDEFYEVESLIADKIVQKRFYLVHWKWFDSSHDTWVDEANLDCPSILKKYKQRKRN